MSLLVQIPNPDISALPKSALSEAAVAGQKTLKVTGVAGLTDFPFLVLGAGTTKAEIVIIDSVTAPDTVTVEANLIYAREKNDIVNCSPWNKVELLSGSVEDVSQQTTSVKVLDIAWHINTTYVLDDSGTSTTYYSFKFKDAEDSKATEQFYLPIYGFPTDITPDYIKSNYLYGLDLTDDLGNPLPDSLYWHGIKAGYHWLEQLLNIDILSRTYVEEPSDFIQGEYQLWAHLRTKHYPVLSVTEVKGQYFGTNVLFPVDWIRSKARMGMVNLVPTQGSFAQFLFPQGGHIMPILSGVSIVPNFWLISYTTGFPAGEVPYNIRDIIAKKACYMPLNILGDLVGGIAVASKNISVDGLSQGLNTTSSAENSGYSARLRQYEREFKAELPMLKSYWGRMTLGVV